MTPSDQLEDLIRSTLHARAGTVTTGAPWAAPAGPRRRRWLPAVAAAAVLVVAAGALAIRSGDERPIPPTGDRPVTACRANLSAPWRAAVHGEPDTVDGHATTPLTTATDGSVVVSWQARPDVETVGVTGRDGRTHALHTFGAGQTVVSADTDGRSVVVNLGPRNDLENIGVADIVAIDLRTRDVVFVLTVAEIARGMAVSSKYGAVVQDGVVYWAAGATSMSPSGGPILGYDIADRTTRVVAQVGGRAADVIRTASGVVWPGGLVPARRPVPSYVPSRPYASTIPVRTDGTRFAWNAGTDRRVIDWADSDGGFRSIRVDLPGATAAAVFGVAGPFVLLTPDYQPGSGNAAVLVLDTRSGAVADLEAAVDPGSAGGSTIALLTQGGTVRVDTSRLPELNC